MMTNDSMTQRDVSHVDSQLITICYAFMAIAGMVTNSVIIGLIVSRRNLRTGSNLLILNLAVSDILMAALSPVTLVVLVSKSWIYGSALCKIIPFVQGIEIFVSSMTVTAIAIDRMLLITDVGVAKWRPGLSNQSLICTTVAIWLVAITLSLPVIVSYQVETVSDSAIFEFDKCLESRNRSYLIGYTIVILFAQFLVPTTALVTSYSTINRYLSRQSYSHDIIKRLKPIDVTFIEQNGSSSQESATIEISSPAPSSKTRTVSEVGHENREYHRNRRAILTLMAIWLFFVISWSPWNFLQVYMDILPNVDLNSLQFNLLFVVCHLLAMSSTITNGILYGFFNTNFRIELNHIRTWMMSKICVIE